MKKYEGVIPHLERAMEKSTSEYRRKKIEENYMDKTVCPNCLGYRINEKARESLIEGYHIGELAQMSIGEILTCLKKRNSKKYRTSNGKAVNEKICEGLEKFNLVGLSYLHLNRSTVSLSGGENQRLSLMTQMNLGLNGVILILDEPTMGMHELEKESLGKILIELRDKGNTVIIVEHDERLISIADLIIDLGPNAGVEGGEIVFSGSLDNIKKCSNSLTGQYLGKTLSYPIKKSNEKRNKDTKKILKMRGISTNNLKDVWVDIPLGLMVGIAGVSGSGKSSLISDTLVPLLQKQFKYNRSQNASNSKTTENNDIEEDTKDPLEIIKGKIEGWELIDDIIIVNQSPIGRNRNSTPASYTGLWDDIRKLYAKLPLAKKRKYKDGHFSFNSDKGRCPSCKGEGRISLSISFLDELSVICEECNGQRYISEILDIKYKDKNIREILDLSVKEGLSIFADEPKIVKLLAILDQIGMGYISLGQSATTLSGGEAQRIKLAKALAHSKKINTLFILDEPSTGLHFHDEVKLILLLDQIVDKGNSVIIIEHNPNILSFCDWLIELGPQGGPKGGEIVSVGKPLTLNKNSESLIGPFLTI